VNSQRQSPLYRSRLLQPGADRSPDTHPLTWRLRDDGQVVGLKEYESKEGYRPMFGVAVVRASPPA
jgi:NADH-quinone oxidoreductase subunit F